MGIRIFIEHRPALGIPNGGGHLYLVLRDESGVNDRDVDEVIRGSQGDLLGTFVGLLDDSLDAYDGDETPADRDSLDITDLFFGGTTYTEADVEAVWAQMEQFVLNLNNVYEYEYPGISESHTSNSNATVLSALNHVGVDVRSIERGDGTNYLEDAGYVTDFPGASNGESATLIGQIVNDDPTSLDSRTSI